MRLAAPFLLALFPACSSSSPTYGSSGLPSCQAPSAAQAAQDACLAKTASCAPYVESVESSCSVFLACYENCGCADEACVTGCDGQQTTACSAALVAVPATCAKDCPSTGE